MSEGKSSNSSTNTKSEKSSSKESSTSKSESSTSKSESSTSKSNSPAESGGSAGRKSTREAVGGSKEVHYGYFSSVRTEEYRSGWDAIWGKKKKKRTNGPVVLDLDFDNLSDEIRDELMEHARKKLKRGPRSFKKLQEEGAIDWIISLKIEN